MDVAVDLDQTGSREALFAALALAIPSEVERGGPGEGKHVVEVRIAVGERDHGAASHDGHPRNERLVPLLDHLVRRRQHTPEGGVLEVDNDVLNLRGAARLVTADAAGLIDG